tara:strand:+ start:2647 stop:3303 length:657 start_codon:yes stop_codon:yes gene_type:complete
VGDRRRSKAEIPKTSASALLSASPDAPTRLEMRSTWRLFVQLLCLATTHARSLSDISFIRKMRADGLPPVGAKYERTLTLPMLGRQVLELYITSRTTAQLVMEGAINLNEQVQYRSDGSGRLAFDLSAGTVQMLRRVRTSLREAEYLSSTDIAIVTVAPPVIPAIRIRMYRTDDSRASSVKASMNTIATSWAAKAAGVWKATRWLGRRRKLDCDSGNA